MKRGRGIDMRLRGLPPSGDSGLLLPVGTCGRRSYSAIGPGFSQDAANVS